LVFEVHAATAAMLHGGTDDSDPDTRPRLSPEPGRSPDAVAGVQQILKSIYAGGVPRRTLELVHMRASQINGCNACIAYGVKSAEEPA
jgi:alkylhydroperoxidase family enzyme